MEVAFHFNGVTPATTATAIPRKRIDTVFFIIYFVWDQMLLFGREGCVNDLLMIVNDMLNILTPGTLSPIFEK